MRVALSLFLFAALAAPAGAAPKVATMVVGKERVLSAPKTVTAKAARVKVGGKRCAVGRGTALAALARLGLRLRLRDYGACGRRAADSTGLFVKRIGPDRNRGQNGWVYKVGHEVWSTGAADTSRRLHGGDRLLWFWCRAQRSGGCQRTLDTTVHGTATAGQPLRVAVRGYDDQARGKAVAGATVTLGSATAQTGPDGVATVTVPAAGRLALSATADGMVPSFRRVVEAR